LYTWWSKILNFKKYRFKNPFFSNYRLLIEEA
jgi:hypothetical protein